VQVHTVTSSLRFTNPYHAAMPTTNYMYDFVVVKWDPAPHDGQPVWYELDVGAAVKEPKLSIRECVQCGRVRILPRGLAPADFPPEKFRCAQSTDERYNSCAKPEFVLRLT